MYIIVKPFMSIIETLSEAMDVKGTHKSLIN